MPNRSVIMVNNIPITISEANYDDYICITDIAAAKSDHVRAADVVKNWLRTKSTIEFLSTWEILYNPEFKVVESDHFKAQSGTVAFTLSVGEWVERTSAIGLYVKRGKYGGTFAHKDIAFEFASAISSSFRLLLIKEFQRLKEQENENLEWLAYAEEADVINVALFGFTAKAWRTSNPDLAKKNNVRDFASVNELTVLSNLESHNAQMIREGKSKEERLIILSEIAEYQLQVLGAATCINNDMQFLEKK